MYHVSLMLKFLKPFLFFIILYHIFVTVIGYGVLGGAYPQLPALGRDLLWGLFFLIILIANFKIIKLYLSTWKWPRMTFVVLLIFSTTMSLYKGKTMFDIFIGIKYGLLYLFIFLSATLIGVVRYKKNYTIQHFLKFLQYILIFILIAGFLRQGLKFIWPDFFLHIGYGPLNDFKFGVKPPIYYLTGYQGTPRRQGIFSGPNNYGYILIAFLPVVLMLFKQKFQSIKTFFQANKKTIFNTSILILRIIAIILTLSRTAFVGGIVSLALLNIKRIKNHKQRTIALGILIFAGLVGISILKGSSTLGHIQAKFGSIKYVITQPSGYGLGTSGPAIHHNGTVLPENYYIQLMLDIGTLGFIIWTLLILQISHIAKKIQQGIKKLSSLDTTTQTIYLLRTRLNIGRIALLIMGIFLHVFEDSMVNYFFFITRGIFTGYLSFYKKKNLERSS